MCHSLELRLGHDMGDISQVSQSLVNLGYRRVDLVTRRGDFAVRGGIVDVFSPLDDHPVRADFFGSVVDELTWFDVSSQRSLPDTLECLDVLPARELLLTDQVKQRARELRAEFPGLDTMLDKMSQGIAVEGMESLQPILASDLMSGH
jgi:transcription-repair coupling factor (superfamily II helicase)